MEDMRFATLRLGKTSVDEIKRMDKSSPGIVATDFNISVKCTQVPPDLNSETRLQIDRCCVECCSSRKIQ